MKTILVVDGIPVEVCRKGIKNLYIRVAPPDGTVRVSCPLRFNDARIRRSISARLGWIRRRKRRFAEETQAGPREMVTGESHYFRGQRYSLKVVERPGRTRVDVVEDAVLRLGVPPGTDIRKRESVLAGWYRQQFRDAIPGLLNAWTPVVGVTVRECRVKRMKTLWGSCNINARRIWLNLELIKRPPSCLEYILVHEMVHLLERRHNARFRGFMDQFLPDWRLRRNELSRVPLAHAG